MLDWFAAHESAQYAMPVTNFGEPRAAPSA